jgi:segregation and condensation protein A
MIFKTEQFNGPLDLLLKLIEKEELDITQISLARITDQYIEYIRKSGRIRAEEMADFLVIAARLLLIKSKALFPYLMPEEEGEIEELERQLKMYKEYVDAMKKVEKMIGRKKFMFAREFSRKAILSTLNYFSPPRNLKSGDLEMAFRDILGRIKAAPQLEESLIELSISIEEKIEAIQNFIKNAEKFNFKKVLSDAATRTEIIVSFLALLELIKQRTIDCTQDSLFGEIEIFKI